MIASLCAIAILILGAVLTWMLVSDLVYGLTNRDVNDVPGLVIETAGLVVLLSICWYLLTVLV